MAIASMHVSVVSRSSGRSSVAAASYRSGEELHNEREGITYNYPRKSGIVYTEILTPENSPDWTHHREQLWNAVEAAEKARNAQTAREITFALPHELSREQNIALAKAYAQTFVHEGMIADVAIHDKGDGNPHCHLLLTMRPLHEDGTWAAKSKKAYVLDDNGERIRLPSGEYKSYKVRLTDWDTPEKLVEWRDRYEHITNVHLEKAGFAERIDVHSYQERGIEQTPTTHLGHYAHQLEQQGISSVRGNINRQVEAANKQVQTINQELQRLEAAQTQELQRQETARLLELARQAAKRHHQKYRRKPGEAGRTLAHPEKEKELPAKTDQSHSLDEEIARRTQEYYERKRHQRTHQRNHERTRRRDTS